MGINQVWFKQDPRSIGRVLKLAYQIWRKWYEVRTKPIARMKRDVFLDPVGQGLDPVSFLVYNLLMHELIEHCECINDPFVKPV